MNISAAIGLLWLGVWVGAVGSRHQFKAAIESLEDELALLKEWKRIAMDRNVAIANIAKENDRLKLREAGARKILEPLAECDPAVREWLGVEVPRTVSLVSKCGNVTELRMFPRRQQ